METTGHDGGGEAPRLIKRYANRKLYDTRDSRYVTLPQIASYVREGEDVTIIDNTTKEDLTNVTLAQIIYEEEKKGEGDRRGGGASSGTLRSLIQHGSERLMTSLREGPMGKLIARGEGEDASDSRPPDAPPEAPAEAKPKANGTKEARRGVFASSKEALDELSRLADDRIRGLLGHAITRVQMLQGEVGRLQSRIEELEESLVKLSRRDEEREAKASEAAAEAPDPD